MLTIRPEQFHVFQPVAEAAFVRRVLEHLLERHSKVVVQLPNEVVPIKHVSNEKLFRVVRNGILRARAYGLGWESSVTAFVVLMFIAAPNFDEHPLIQRILKDERVPADSRIDELWERTSDENWEVVRKNYDVTAWGADAEEVDNDR